MRNKDPAVLFYTSDFLTGVTLMNYEQRGKYITLLCLQHQNGHLSEEDMLAVCGKFDKKIFSKFKKDEEGLYYNERIDEEKERRRAYTESQSKNAKKRWLKRYEGNTEAMPRHKPSENENEIDNKIILSSEVKKDNNISRINNTNTFSFSTNNSAGACEGKSPLKHRVVQGSENSAYLFMNDEQIEDLRNRLTPAEFDYYLCKMTELYAMGYKFGCSDYEQILKMADQDRGIRKDGNNEKKIQNNR